MNIRVDAQPGVSLSTRKNLKAKTTTAVKYHMHFCNHIVSLKDFKILASSNSEFYIKITENFLVSRDKRELNRNEKSLPPNSFD